MNLKIKAVGIVAAFALVLGAAAPASAATTAELIDLLVSLGIISADQVDVVNAAVGGSSTSSSCAIQNAPDMTLGSTGANVTELQQFLVAEGYLTMPAGVSYGYFGGLTQAALASYQAANGITPAVGYFGPITRSSIPCAPVADDSDDADVDEDEDDSDLQGGAGVLDEAKFVGSLTNEEVGEGEDDIEVMGLDIKPEGSDIEIVAVDLDFDKGAAANSNFTKYASEVSIMLEGEVFATIDADEFTRSNNYRKTISLDRGAIIREGDMGELSVAVSGISNIDSDDEGDTWIVGVRSLRYVDAQGAYITDSSTDNIGDSNDDTTENTDERSFTFESFATGSSLKFKVRSGDSSINTNNLTIEVSSTTKVTGEAVLSATFEVDGDSDMLLDQVVVDATTTNALLTSVISTAYLYIDGERVGSESVTSAMATAAEITFDDLNYDLDAGDTYDVEVRVDFQKATGSFTSGTTIDVDMSSTDVASTTQWIIEDENGDTVGASDRSGSASAEANKLVTQGVQIVVASQKAEQVVDANSTAANYGKFTIDVEVTAVGDTIYVLETAASSTVALTSSGLQYVFEDTTGAQVATASSTSGSFTHKSGGSIDGSSISIGDTESATFTFVGTFDPTTAGQYRVRVVGVGFGTTNAGTGSSQTATPVTSYRTDNVYIAN